MTNPGAKPDAGVRSREQRLATIIAAGVAAPRTLPRPQPSRTALRRVGERPERIGPPAKA